MPGLPVFRHQGDDHGGHDAVVGGLERRVALHQHVDQHDDGDQQVTALTQHHPGAGQAFLGDALEAQALGFHMHHEAHGQVIQQGGHQGRLGDLHVTDAQELGHDEGRSPHDGRHDLATGGRGGFHGAGKGTAIAHALHERDGEGTRGHRIGHGRTGNGTEETTGQHGHLGGAAHVAAGSGQGQVDEELAQTGAVQEGTEQDEQEDEGGRHAQRHAEQAFRGQIHVRDDTLHGETGVPQHAGDQVAELGVQQEDHGHQGDGDAHDTAGRLQHQQDGRTAHDEVQLGGRTGIQHNDVILPDDVAADHGPGDGQDGVIPGQLVHVARGAGRIQQIDQGQHKAQMHRALDLGRKGRRGGRVQMKSGKGDTKDLDKNIEPPLEGAVNGFLVVLGNDLGDVHGLLDLLHSTGIQFVAFFQGKSPCPLFIDHMHSFFVAHPLMSCVSMRACPFTPSQCPKIIRVKRL